MSAYPRCDSVESEGRSVNTDPAWDELDEKVKCYLRQYEIPNGQVSIVSADGRLVFSRAYTNYNVETSDGQVVASVEHRFRIGSVTKVLTAIATLQLVEGRAGFGLGGLDDEAWRYVDFTDTLDLYDVM